MSRLKSKISIAFNLGLKINEGEIFMDLIHTPDAAAPGGHYSQAVKCGDIVYVSGILPIDVDGQTTIDSFEEQARCVFRNAEAILQAAGADFTFVTKSTVYITDIGNWEEFNGIYAEAFGEHKPARVVVPVPVLHHGCGVELELVAFNDNKARPV